MKFLRLAHGDEDGWNSLSDEEKRKALDQDAAIRDRENLMSAMMAYNEWLAASGLGSCRADEK